MCQNLVITYFGSQQVRLQKQGNCLVVDIEGDCPIAVYQTLREIIQQTITSCGIFLCCSAFASAHQFNPQDDSTSPGTVGATAVEAAEDIRRAALPTDMFLSLLEITRCLRNNEAFLSNDRRHRLPLAGLRWLFQAWLQDHSLVDIFDLMFSYRWDEDDSLLMSVLAEKFTYCTIDESQRAVHTFLDKNVLQGMTTQCVASKMMCYSIRIYVYVCLYMVLVEFVWQNIQ